MPGYQPRHDTDPVWFGDQQVNNLLVASQQTGVRITAIYGWDERPDVRDVRELRSGQDGEYADNLYLGGRTITVEGEVYGSSWVDLQARKRTLAALFNPSSTETTLKVPNPASFAGLTTWSASGMTGYERSSLRVMEAIQFGDTLDPACQVWQVVLRASDPRVYSDTATSTASTSSGTDARTVSVTPSGTYATPATITIAGPAGEDTVVQNTTSGLQLSLNRSIVVGESWSIDLQERTVDLTTSYRGSHTLGPPVPLALWMLDETSGTTADNAEGTSARDATYTGGFTLNQAGPNSLTAVSLNGTTGYVAIPNVTALYPDTNPMLDAWVRWTSVADSVIYDGITSNRGFRVRLTTATNLRVTVGNGSSTRDYNISLPFSITSNTWYRIIVNFDKANPRYQWVRIFSEAGATLYSADGVSFGSNDSYSAATSGGARLGSLLSGGAWLSGRIAAVALYNSSDIASVAALPITASGLTNGYQFLTASASRWANVPTGASSFSLSSATLNTGSQLTVSYRDARL